MPLPELTVDYARIASFNAEQDDKSWNFVLPVLLQNMAEAPQLIDGTKTA